MVKNISSHLRCIFEVFSFFPHFCGRKLISKLTGCDRVRIVCWGTLWRAIIMRLGKNKIPFFDASLKISAKFFFVGCLVKLNSLKQEFKICTKWKIFSTFIFLRFEDFSYSCMHAWKELQSFQLYNAVYLFSFFIYCYRHKAFSKRKILLWFYNWTYFSPIYFQAIRINSKNVLTGRQKWGVEEQSWERVKRGVGGLRGRSQAFFLLLYRQCCLFDISRTWRSEKTE